MLYSFNDLTVRIWCGLISPKNILTFPKNFLNFKLDSVKKHCIINLGTSVVVIDSEATFWGREECSYLSIFLLCFVYRQGCIIKSVLSNFLVFQTLGGISLKPANFLPLIFVCTASSSTAFVPSLNLYNKQTLTVHFWTTMWTSLITTPSCQLRL